MIKLAQEKENKLVDMLCVAYSKELKAYHGYLHAYVTVTGPMETVYGDIYEKFMEREMEHLEELGKKIVAMGGMPPTEYPPIKAVADAVYKGYDATLAALQDAEVETLEMYKQIHAATEKAGDLPLTLLIEHIMEEEEQHHDELVRILMDVPKEDNVEVHDELEIDAFYIRTKKVAGLFNDIKQVDRYVKELRVLNKLIADMENHDGNAFSGDVQANPKYKELEKMRENVVIKLNDLSDDWVRAYFGDEEEQGEDVEPELTMKDYA